MSCDTGNCGCGGQQGGKQKPTGNTPVTAPVRIPKKSAGPKPPPAPGPLNKVVAWIGHRVFADMRITRIRVIAQAFFFILFLFFVIITDLRYLKGYPVSLFLEMDPLVGVATTITTWSVYKGLILGLVLLLPTLFLGRFFCNWICP